MFSFTPSSLFVNLYQFTIFAGCTVSINTGDNVTCLEIVQRSFPPSCIADWFTNYEEGALITEYAEEYASAISASLLAPHNTEPVVVEWVDLTSLSDTGSRVLIGVATPFNFCLLVGSIVAAVLFLICQRKWYLQRRSEKKGKNAA